MQHLYFRKGQDNYERVSKKYCSYSGRRFETWEEIKSHCTGNSNCFGFQGSCNGAGDYETCKDSDWDITSNANSCIWMKKGII